MKLTNEKIYTYAIKIAEQFTDEAQKLPVKINFYLQKNKTTLLELAQGIEKARAEIIQNYGELDENGENYKIASEKIADASKELEDLFTLEQEVQIYTVSVDTLPDDISLTTGQMEAIMFMID